MEPAETIEYRGHEIEIFYDEMAESPRDWDPMGTMICKSSRYSLGDIDKSDSYHRMGRSVREDMANYFYNEHCAEIKKVYPGIERHEDECGDLTEYGIDLIWKWINSDVIMLNLYLYDHGGITMNTGGYSCRWDSGQCGFIYVTKNQLRKHMVRKKVDKKLMERAREILNGEVETYDTFIRGDVFCYTVSGPYCTDGCGGWYGWDHEESGLLMEARASIDYAILWSVKEHLEQLKKWIKNKVPLPKREPLTLDPGVL